MLALNRFRYLFIAAISLVVLLSVQLAAAASSGSGGSAPKAAAGSNDTVTHAVTQSYNADPSVQSSMIVELKPKDPSTVIPLKYEDIRHMLGVVVPTGDASIVLTPAKITKQQVLVATTGHYYVLVSNQQGPIKVGDGLTISALAGIGMKASESESQIIGKAAGDFNGTSNVLGSVKLKDTVGKQSTVAIGRVPVDISISHNPLSQKTADYVPGFLAKAAVAVASKPVSAARIYLSLVLLFVAAFITGSVLYSGIRSGMIAVGRNPLSKKSIIRSLIETVIAGLIIFVAGVFAVYLLLKL